MNKNCNVLDYGADPTGKKDATMAFQEAIDALTKQGILYIPKGRYWIKGHILLRSYITIQGWGHPILFNQAKEGDDYVIFYGKSTTKGYDGGVQDVTIKDVILQGSFRKGALKGASITLHHGKNINIENCTFTEAIINGHGVDLLGCQNIQIRHCLFEGMHVLSKREYVEAIQLDHSTAEGNGAKDTDYTGMDGLPTIDVLVEHCVFRSLILNGIKYPAPNPIGSHSRVINNKLRNISFRNNLIIGCGTTKTTTFCKGWLHFCWAENIIIKDNIFINHGNTPSTVISTPSFTTAFQAEDVQDKHAKKVNTIPEVTHSLSITNNQFIDFITDDAEPVISITGKEYQKKQYLASNIIITDNRFINNQQIPAKSIESWIQTDMVTKVTIANNTTEMYAKKSTFYTVLL